MALMLFCSVMLISKNTFLAQVQKFLDTNVIETTSDNGV